MNWEQINCGDSECHQGHWRYYDETTEEIVGTVSGSETDGWLISYRGNTIACFRTSTAAMERLAKIHEDGGPGLPLNPDQLAKYMAATKDAMEKAGIPFGLPPFPPPFPNLLEVPAPPKVDADFTE